ncbi:MAG: hypothetical protein JOZ54_21460 [Acidobacteria bacterium]|nr:hypothetical protein [Acidobacteriota bacterium]
MILTLLLALVFSNPLLLGTGSTPEIAQTDAGSVVLWKDNSLKVTLGGSNVTTTLLDRNPAAYAIATRGPESVAVWADGAKISAVRLDGRGVPIGDPKTIATTTTAQVAIASNGDRYLVAWSGLFGDIWALILDANGSLFLPPTPVTTQTIDTPTYVHVASNGDEFLISWTADRRVFAHLVGDNGFPHTFLPVQMTSVGGPSDVASNGHDFLVVWQRPPFGVGIGARAMFANGAVSDEMLLTQGTDGEPRIAWDGAAYSVLFDSIVRSGSRDIPVRILQRFTATGSTIETASGPFGVTHAIAARNGRIAVATADSANVYLSYVDALPVPSRRRALR